MTLSASNPVPSNEDRVRAALWFAQRGFGVFSVWSVNDAGVCRCRDGVRCGSPGKHPVPPDGFKAATRDPQRISTMLSHASNPNYGLLPPEGVFVLDVDGDGIPQLAELEERLGPLPPTLRTHTAHGQHIFLHWPTDVPRPIGHLFGFVTRWGSGKDAGYVIGPRSVHATGAEYRPDNGALNIASLPDAWAQAVIAPKPAAFIEIEGPGYQLPPAGYSGSRYEAILSYIASRYMRGISRDEIEAGVLTVLAPRFASPLGEQELRSRFERAWRGTAERLGEPLDLEPLSASAPPVSMPNWPQVPDPAAFHGVLGEIVRAVASRTEADPIGILGSLLATCGACMGHGRYIYQGSQQTANLFVVLVGDTATGRKGTAGSIAREVMNAAYPDWQQLVVAGLGSGEGLIAHLKRTEDAEPLPSSGRALVMESEFGRLLTVMNREGSTLSPVVRDAWDGGPMGRFLAREQQLVTWHHVSILAHVTPVELRAKLNDVDAANGFGNRFLWLAVRRTQLLPFPESPRLVIQPYVSDLNAAIVDALGNDELHWSEAAARRWEALYMELSRQPRHGLLGALAARAESQITRLALIYALLDRAPAIDVAHLEAAVAVWDYSEQSMAYVFGTSTGNRHADVLRDMLTADGPIEWRTAKEALGLRSAADLRDAVDQLVGNGIAEVVSRARPNGGRAARVIQLIERKIENESEQRVQRVQRVLPPAQGNGQEGTHNSA